MGATTSQFERARLRMISARVSPMVELARWLLERQGLAYAEEPHVPMVHVLFTRLAKGGDEIPVVVTPEAVWGGGPRVVAALDEKAPPDRRLFPDDPALRRTDEDFVAFLFAHLLKQVRRHVYRALLPYPELVAPVVTDGAPEWERLFVYLGYPLWRMLMERGLDFAPDLIAAAPGDILAAFAAVEARLQPNERFLGGDAPGTLDIVFAALTAPIVFPAQYGAKLPALERLPYDLRRFVEALRARRAGRLALEVYATARGVPQPRLGWRAAGREWPPAWLTRAGANWLRRLKPRLKVGKYLALSRWNDAQAALADDLAYSIAPINAARISEVCGDFVLGMDRGARLSQERQALYSALGAVDLDAVLRTALGEAKRLLQAAARSSGRIDVVNGYARLVAARAAARMTGIRGPSEPDLLRVARRLFHHTFLNLSGEAKVRELAVAAGGDLRAWIDAEIAARRRSGCFGDDMLGKLIAQAPASGLDDDAVRRTVAGVFVGAIDTTTTAVAHIVAEMISDPAATRRAVADVGDRRRFLAWCWEFLRRRPHNPILLRAVADGGSFDGVALNPGDRLVVVTLAAMHDPSTFETPERMDPTRPFDRYLHFGAGLHACAGRDVNARLIPALVGALLEYAPEYYGPIRMDGPFCDEQVVRLRSGVL